MATFVLEIGSEEIPAAFLATQESALEKAMRKALAEAHLGYSDMTVNSTPRRLVLRMDNVNAYQDGVEEIITGPAVNVAYAEDGKPTRALQGFCKSQSADISDVFTLDTKKGKYVAARKKSGGLPASQVLAEILPAIISGLPFAKKMRWADHHLAHARPIRWILAMLDDMIVPFSLEHLDSCNVTYGHRVHGAGPFKVGHADNFGKILENDCQVVLDGKQRLSLIKIMGDSLAEAKNGHVIWREDLLEEVSGLVEYPVAILGKFDKSFLEIPEEVLLTSMQTHQKSFGLRDQTGNLLPYFLTVLNLQPKDEDLVRQGWERVLKARLEDARFFWREDLKTGFQPWLAKLENVIFIGELGSMAEKSRRIAKLCAWLAAKTGLADIDSACRAGELCKADLVSGMVGEFDTLQGVMGGIYAKMAGESEVVSNAVAQQYLPLGPDTDTPDSPLGALLSLADKADTLAGCFGIGKIPTGAADPDGLRRAALGIIRIMLTYNIRIPLDDIFNAALELYGEKKWKYSKIEILAKLRDFMTARLRNWLVAGGHNNLVVDAVLDKPFFTPSQAQAKIVALEKFYNSGDALEAVSVFKRMENIIKKADNIDASWQEELLAEDAEKKLALLAGKLSPLLDTALHDEKYEEVLEQMKNLRQPVDEFFENVMIMCEDENLRNNRLALLNSLLTRFGQIATFAKLQLQG